MRCALASYLERYVSGCLILRISESIGHGEPPAARTGLRWRGFLMPSGSCSLQELEPCAFLCADQQTDTEHICSEDGQGDRAGEASLAMGAHPVQAALLEIVDRRLDGGMLLARQDEVRLRLVCAAAGGHGVEFQPVAEGGLVLRAVKAAVEAAGEEFREALSRGLDDGNRSIRVAPLPQEPVLEEELVLVLDDRDGNAQLHGDARLPLAVPPRMFLEDRKDLLLLRDLLPLQDPPVRLVDLALRMRDVSVEFLP